MLSPAVFSFAGKAPSSTPRFETRWNPSLGRAEAGVAPQKFPAHCELGAPTSSPALAQWMCVRVRVPPSVRLTCVTCACKRTAAVVGAGWGGSYLAWRLSVDTQTVNASGVCVFEGNGRVGGRIFSVRDLPHFGDLTVDVGGYRFQETQKLPADLAPLPAQRVASPSSPRLLATVALALRVKPWAG